MPVPVRSIRRMGPLLFARYAAIRHKPLIHPRGSPSNLACQSMRRRRRYVNARRMFQRRRGPAHLHAAASRLEWSGWTGRTGLRRHTALHSHVHRRPARPVGPSQPDDRDSSPLLYPFDHPLDTSDGCTAERARFSSISKVVHTAGRPVNRAKPWLHCDLFNGRGRHGTPAFLDSRHYRRNLAVAPI